MARQVLTIPDVPPTLLQTATADNKYIWKAGAQTKSSTLWIEDPTNITLLGVRTTGNANPKFRVRSDGRISWGDGTAAVDTDFDRVGVNQLRYTGQWASIVQTSSPSYTFRNGADNFGTMIYAQFGYGGDGNNPRMQFGCNAWFPPYGGTRPNPTKQVAGLASGLIVVEAAGSGGVEAGRVPLVDFIWQDGGWTTQYVTAMRLYNGGSIDLVGTRPTVAIKNSTAMAPFRLSQWYGGSQDSIGYISTNTRYDGTQYLLDDTTRDGAMITLGAQVAVTTFHIDRVAAGANPRTPIRLLSLDPNGQLELSGSSAQLALRARNDNAAGHLIHSQAGNFYLYDRANARNAAMVDNTAQLFLYSTGANSLNTTGNLYVGSSGATNNTVEASGRIQHYQNGSNIIGTYFHHGGVLLVGGCEYDPANQHVLLGRDLGWGARNTRVGGTILAWSDNFGQVGSNTNRFASFWAVNGAIQTSSIKFKDPLGDLDPEAALRAVLRTPARRFKYKGSDLTQHGYYMEEADPLFTIGPDATTPSNDAGVLLAAMQALCARLGITA